MWQRRGVVDGVDFGATGEVKKIDVDRICERLDGGSVVLLRNLGHSSSGEVLNCKYARSSPEKNASSINLRKIKVF